MHETKRTPTTITQCPTLSYKWHRIFYMPSHLEMAGPSKALDYPVNNQWGEKSRWSVFRCNTDVNRRSVYPQSNTLTTVPPRPPPPIKKTFVSFHHRICGNKTSLLCAHIYSGPICLCASAAKLCSEQKV